MPLSIRSDRRGRALFTVLAAGAAMAVSAPSLAQDAGPSGAVGRRIVVSGVQRPEYVTLAKMQRRISLDVTESRLEDVLTFIKEFTDADIEYFWMDNSGVGLDKDKLITINVKNRPALDMLEQVLEKARSDFSENNWQVTRYGTLQVGPEEALNRYRRVEMYDINDLLFRIPSFTDAPQIDLQSLLQQSQGGGGGGGQTPFTDTQDAQNRTAEEARQERMQMIDNIVELIQVNVEPEQWVDNGGEAATVRYFQGHLLVNAPDYVHRGIVGYSYWPTTRTVVAQGGRRYVSIGIDTSIGTVDGFDQRPVTGVVPGGGGGPGGPGGPGEPGGPG